MLHIYSSMDYSIRYRCKSWCIWFLIIKSHISRHFLESPNVSSSSELWPCCAWSAMGTSFHCVPAGVALLRCAQATAQNWVSSWAISYRLMYKIWLGSLSKISWVRRSYIDVVMMYSKRWQDGKAISYKLAPPIINGLCYRVTHHNSYNKQHGVSTSRCTIQNHWVFCGLAAALRKQTNNLVLILEANCPVPHSGVHTIWGLRHPQGLATAPPTETQDISWHHTGPQDVTLHRSFPM